MSKRIIIEGAPLDKLGRRKRPKIFNVDREWFFNKYAIELVPTWLLAQEIGCVENHISAIADMFSIPRRGRLGRTKDRGPKIHINIEEAVRLYFDEKMNANDVGAALGCSADVVRSRLREHGHKIRHHNDTKRGAKSKNRIELDHNIVVAMYLEKYASGQTVADHFGVSRQVIDRILREEGVPKKPMSESRNNWGENGPNWKSHITPEEREQRRDMASQARWRAKVYKRDNYTCQKCGCDKGGNLNSHHIVPHSADRSIAWDVDNGITLCKPCHCAFHKLYGYTKCTPEDLAEYLSAVEQ